MSGGEVAYNLRPNKYVERHLFIELLGKLIGRRSPETFTYISLGGPQMEDHHLVHQHLDFRSMISLELDASVHQRQIFNRRPGFIWCINQSSGSFIDEFELYADEYQDKEFIIWLDYASARDRLEQLLEFQKLLQQLQIGDVLKITLNANPGTLGSKMSRESDRELFARRLEEFSAQFGEHYPSERVATTDLTGNNFPPLLCRVAKKLAQQVVRPASTKIVPLAVFCYQDGPHLMLTITVQLMKGVDVARNLEQLKTAGWEYLPSDWDNVTKIRVPNLTPKERLHIESHLFSADNATVHAMLPFRLDSDEAESLTIFEDYVRHYRRYPSYFQVVL